MYPIRPFHPDDRTAVEALGVTIIDYWDQHVALHRVAGDRIVGHLQAVDRGTTPSRRPGSIEMRLTVAPEHRRRGIGSRLYERVLAFAEERQADSIRASYFEHSPEEPALFFLKRRGFVELQRYQPSRLDVRSCDLGQFEDLEQRLVGEGVRFLTYADVPDTDENRQKLFTLDQEARSDLPERPGAVGAGNVRGELSRQAAAGAVLYCPAGGTRSPLGRSLDQRHQLGIYWCGSRLSAERDRNCPEGWRDPLCQGARSSNVGDREPG